MFMMPSMIMVSQAPHSKNAIKDIRDPGTKVSYRCILLAITERLKKMERIVKGTGMNLRADKFYESI